MNRRRQWVSALVVGFCAVGALGLTYTWDGGGWPSIRWDNCPNWNLEEMTPCWPSGGTDTAIIPARSGDLPQPWDINLVNATIQNATVYWGVNFGAADPNTPVLRVSDFQINSNGTVEITITGAKITTAP